MSHAKFNGPMVGMINDEHELVDSYLPRKCDYTNKILNAKDKSSVQINIASVDANGKATGKFETVVLSGFLRQKGQSAGAFEHVLKKRGLYPVEWNDK